MRRDDLAIATPFAAPGSPLEQLVCECMAEALELDSVGLDDDFFALGGDSHAAEVFFLAIEEATACRLPLATLYERPTARELLPLVSSTFAARSEPVIARLRADGAKAPLFIVPGLGGEVLGMEPLVRHLPADRPVYCCQFAGTDGTDKPLQSIEEMAAGFLPHLHRLQPSGPYHLLGACFGGLVALELAQRLHSQGHKVGLLCLCDTPFPVGSEARVAARLPAFLSFLGARAVHFVRELRSGPLKARGAYLRDKARRTLSLLRKRELPPDVRHELAKRRLVEANRTASRRYTVRSYAGRAVYVRSGGRAEGTARARRLMWRGVFSEGLEAYTVACRDSGELFAAKAEELSAIVSRALRTFESSDGS